MKKKIMIAIAIVLAVLLCVNFFPKRPFSNLTTAEISSVERKYGELYVDQLSEEEISTLVEDLKEIKIKWIDLGYWSETGMPTALCNGMYTIHYTNGKEDIIICEAWGTKRFIWNNVCFICDSEANIKIMEEYWSHYEN